MPPGLEVDGGADLRAAGIAEVGVDHAGIVQAQKRAAVGRQIESVGAVGRHIEIAGVKQADVVVAGADGEIDRQCTCRW